MSSVTLIEGGIKALWSKPNSPIGRVIDKKAELIRAAALANIQTKTEARSGDLEASLRKIPISGDVYHVAVGSDAAHRGFPYARALETGENPLTGAPMNFHEDKAFMVPAVRSAGFRLRRG